VILICVVLRCLCQIHVHSTKDIPLVSDLGFFVEPGKHSLVSVDYSRVSQEFYFKLIVKIVD